jgi:hypothetical protein
MRIKIQFVVLLAGLLGACQQDTHEYSPKKTEKKLMEGILKIVVPDSHAYGGAYIDFGDHEDNVTLEGIERFDKLVHKQQAIIAFSSDWGNQGFPDRQLNIISNYGAVPLVFWSPWDRPDQGWDSKPGRFDLNTIIAGQWDEYIDLWATSAREYGKPLFVSWGLEMNGHWFPWSGVYYGAGQAVEGCANCFAGPETFKKAYRHVVDRVRARGATNILWVWHANNSSDPDEPWNAMARYYPGPSYVDWVAMTAYGTQFANTEDWFTYDEALGMRCKTLAQVDGNKPLMLAEWGVGEFPKKGSKAKWIAEFFARLPVDCPRIRAAIFWHERWQNDDQSISNLRVNSSFEALEAYQKGIADPFWLSRPLFSGADDPK